METDQEYIIKLLIENIGELGQEDIEIEKGSKMNLTFKVDELCGEELLFLVHTAQLFQLKITQVADYDATTRCGYLAYDSEVTPFIQVSVREL